MKIKVCGLNQPENIAAVSALDIDLIGLIFHEDSPRFAGDKALAQWISTQERTENGPERVGVFVNAEMDYILNTVHDYQLDWVQLHGEESPGYCQELQLLWSVSTSYKAKICKAFSITPEFDFRRTNDYISSAPLFVFDTGGQASAGGTGRQWDWQLLDNYQGLTPFLLSGGIGPNDAKKIKALQHPQFRGVDLNSGFELEPGVKDVEQLRLFIDRLQA